MRHERNPGVNRRKFLHVAADSENLHGHSFEKVVVPEDADLNGDIHMKIPQSLREVIAKGPYAHLTTLNRDGSPQVTVVWVGIEGEEFVIGHLAEHQKVKNIRRDPRVAVHPQRPDQRAGDAGICGGVRQRAHNRRQRSAPAATPRENLSGSQGSLPTTFDAQHSGFHHPHRARPLYRGRTVGCQVCRVKAGRTTGLNTPGRRGPCRRCPSRWPCRSRSSRKIR